MTEGLAVADGSAAATALYLSVAEVAARLGLSTDTVYNRLRDQQLPSVNLGGVFRIPAVALDLLAPRDAFRLPPRLVQFTGYVRCGADRGAAASDCAGYVGREAALLKQTIFYCAADLGAQQGDRYYEQVEKEVISLHPVDPADRWCAQCHAINSLSEDPPHIYPRRSGTDPDTLVHREREARQGVERQADAAERSAAAAEQANELRRLELADREAERALRERELAARQAEVAPPAPTPAPKPKARAAT